MKRRTNLGAALRIYRSAKDWDMRLLGAEIGISSATVCRLENGHSPDSTTLLRLLEWLLKPEPRKFI